MADVKLEAGQIRIEEEIYTQKPLKLPGIRKLLVLAGGADLMKGGKMSLEALDTGMMLQLLLDETKTKSFLALLFPDEAPSEDLLGVEEAGAIIADFFGFNMKGFMMAMDAITKQVIGTTVLPESNKPVEP